MNVGSSVEGDFGIVVRLCMLVGWVALLIVEENVDVGRTWALWVGV